MTYTIDTELRDQLQLRGAEVDVFFFLRSVCRGEAVYHAGLSSLSNSVGLSLRNVKDAVKNLCERGLIVMDGDRGNHKLTYCVAKEFRLNRGAKNVNSEVQKMHNRSAEIAPREVQKLHLVPIKNIINDNHTLLDVMCENAHAGEDGFFSILSTEQMWREAVCMQRHLTMDELSQWLDTFAGECRIKAAYHASVNDLKRHFCDWLTIQTEKAAKQKRTNEPEPISLDILARDYSKQ